LLPPCLHVSHPQDPFLNIAPKKLNWDLKREVADRLDQLRKRTLKAINEIVAEKVRQQEEEEEEEDEEDAESAHAQSDGRDSSKQARALGRSAATGSANAEEIDLD
jgi:hypothetical protein